MQFLGVLPWLLSASWKNSRFQAALIIFVVVLQVLFFIMALHVSKFSLLAVSAIMIACYIWAGYVGAERLTKEPHQG